MSQYRRYYLPGGTFFLTLVTYNRQLLFESAENLDRLRNAVIKVKKEKSFVILGAVILPDHIHFLWQLPPNDSDYSQRVSRLKVLFTRSLHGKNALSQDVSVSRRKHRESNIWQRRFWEHTIRNETDFQHHLDYIHYNPVKHGLVSCPHFWQYSSFSNWVNKGIYSQDWGCACGKNKQKIPDFSQISRSIGE